MSYSIQASTSPEAFRKKTFPYLLKDEAINCVPIGIINHLADDPEPRWQKYYLNWLEKARKVVGTFTMTPPHPLILSPMPKDCLEAILKASASFADKPKGVLGLASLADLFAEGWLKQSNGSISSSMSQGIFQANHVITPRKANGNIVTASDEHFEQLKSFYRRFIRDCGLAKENDTQITDRVRRNIVDGNLFVWLVDQTPVAMAGVQGKTPNGIRVGYVYTDDSHRGKGYASNLVASITQLMLHKGNKFCFLYTDLANPTSNSVYQAIGYQKVATSRFILFSDD